MKKSVERYAERNKNITLHMKDNKVFRQIKKLVSLLDNFHLIKKKTNTCYLVQAMLVIFCFASLLKIWFKNMVLPYVTICQTVANQYTYTQIYKYNQSHIILTVKLNTRRIAQVFFSISCPYPCLSFRLF